MTTAWGTAIKRGHSTVLSVLIDGIPYVFAERLDKRVDANAKPTVPSGYTLSEALSITRSMAISCDMDRESGVASGRALDLLLAWGPVESEGLDTALFKRPTYSTRLTSDVDDADDTAFPVEDTTGFSSPIYIGLEHCTYSGSTGTSFDPVVRGVAGMEHVHKSDSVGGYKFVTDTPQHWKGRLVTVWEHLVSPEGRVLCDVLAEADDYSRQLWRGFIDEPPRPTVEGMVLKCLPVVRKAETTLGGAATGTITPFGGSTVSDVIPGDQIGGYSIMTFGQGDTIQIEYTDDNSPVGTGSAVLPLTTDETTVRSMKGWTSTVQRELVTEFNGAGWWLGDNDCSVDVRDGHVVILVGEVHGAAGGGTRLRDISAMTMGAWFLKPGIWNGKAYAEKMWRIKIPLDHSPAQGWLTFLLDAPEAGAVVTIPTSGYAVIEQNGAREFVAFDDSKRHTGITADGSRACAIRVSARAIMGGQRLRLWQEGGQISIVTGHTGPLAEVFETILTSSGLTDGDRGTYDTLAYGYGLNLPSSWVDTSRIRGFPLDAMRCAAVTDSDSSLEDLIGGWLALLRLCLVQRRDSSGNVVLTVADTTPGAQTLTASDTTGLTDTLTTAEVLIGGHEAPELIEAPNVIRVARGVLDDEQITIVQDAPRATAEGSVEWEFTAPGISDSDALAYGTDILRYGEGLQAIQLRLPPFVEVQVGQAVNLDTAHPAVYDFNAGARKPSSIAARVSGWEQNLYTGEQTVTLLLEGYAPAPVWLCPTMTVASTPAADTIAVGAGEGEHAVIGDSLYLYTPGDEASESETLVVDTITTSTNQIQFTTNTAGWVGAGTKVTFPAYGSATARQQAYAYVHADTEFV